jgi:septal ring factor EnvC (AmiA/AmiB activator)
MRITSAFIFCIIFLFTTNVISDDRKNKEKELRQLKSRIEKLRNTIEVKENSKSSYSRQLRQTEKKIGQITKKIRLSNQQIRSKQQSLDKLRQNKRKIEQRIDQQNQKLAKQIYSAYTLGQQERLKLLFSQEKAASLQRNLTYYEYFSRYRLSLIVDAQKTFNQLLDNERQINQAKLDLEKDLSTQKQQKATFTSDRKKRKNIISKLDRELKTQGKYLTQLEENARNLKQLIESLSEILTDIPSTPSDHKKFSSLKGRLSWPAKGKVKKLFGQTISSSNLRWQGVIIQAPEGNNVRSVSHGRVAFSDWLRGMGNLIIIDHGNNYLSLYGHNQSLFKTTGEWVEAGDIIGSIGNSGGQQEPGLYFEIRIKGKPQNPSRWCDSKNWFTG